MVSNRRRRLSIDSEKSTWAVSRIERLPEWTVRVVLRDWHDWPSKASTALLDLRLPFYSLDHRSARMFNREDLTACGLQGHDLRPGSTNKAAPGNHFQHSQTPLSEVLHSLPLHTQVKKTLSISARFGRADRTQLV